MTTSHDRYTIEVLDLAMAMLESMAQGQTEYSGASELAHRLGTNRGRTFRILKTLERRGWVEFNLPSQNYRLGWKLLFIAERIRERLDTRREAIEVLRQLTESTGEAVGLLVLYGDRAVCVEQQTGSHLLQVADLVGRPLPLHVGAGPKILLAYLAAEEGERLIEGMQLAPYTPATITDKGDLRRCLEVIRRQGYAVDNQDYETGVHAVGAPVRDHNGRVVAAVSVTTPEARYSAEREMQLIRSVIEAADKVSARLGYQAPCRPSRSGDDASAE